MKVKMWIHRHRHIIELFFAGGTMLATMAAGFIVYDQLKAIDDGTYSVQRAFLVAIPPEVLGAPSIEGTPTVRFAVKWKNYGPTPARDISIAHICSDLPPGATPDMNIPTSNRMGGFVLGGGETEIMGMDRQDARVVSAVQSSRAIVWCWGSAVYHDVFGHKRTTRYCFKITGVEISPGDNTKANVLAPPCDVSFACTDEKCPAEPKH